MALADAKAHVTLNGKDYILIEESYEKRAQQPFTARFATGDPTEGDNSFWQFLSQRGWVSEGQEIFSIVNNFRQSSGWDIRGNQAGSLGHPRIGYGIESLALLASPPVPYSSIGSQLLEDFHTGTIDWAKWNDGGPYGDAAAQTDGTEYLAHTGYHASGQTTLYGAGNAGANLDGLGPFTLLGFSTSYVYESPKPSISADPGDAANVPARGSSQTVTQTWVVDVGAQTFRDSVQTDRPVSDAWVHYQRTQTIGQIGKTGLSLGNTGDYAFDLYIRNSDNIIQAAVAFLMNSTGGGYVLEISGVGGSTVKLFKTTKSNAWDNTADTLLKTWTTNSRINTQTTYTVSLAAGVFTLKQDGVTVAGGTVTDTAYTTGDTYRFTTAYDVNGNVTIGNIYVPSTGGSASATTGKFLHYNNQLLVAYPANGGVDFTFTDLVAASVPSNLPKITHVVARDICCWDRDGDPSGGLNSVTGLNRFLCVVAGQTLKIYKGTTLAYTVATTGYGGLIVPVNSNTLLVIGTTAVNSGTIVIDRLAFTANTWTQTPALGGTATTIHLDGGVAGQLVNSYTFDANGTLFFASNDISGTVGGMPSRVYQITSTDVLATNLTISSVTSMPDFVVRGIAGLYNSLNVYLPFAVYLIGASLEGGNAYPAVMRYPGELVYKGTKSHNIVSGSLAELFNFGIATHWATAKNIRFLGHNDDNSWDPIVELDVDQFFREVASFNSGQFDTANPNAIAIAEWNGRFYCLNGQAGTVKRTTAVRGGLGTDFDAAHPTGSCILKLSDMGRNTSLINKSMFSVYLEIDSALPASTSTTSYTDPTSGKVWSIGNNDLVISLNGIVVGTMTAADCTPNSGGLIRKEMILPFELTASVFTPRISINASSTWTGFLKYFMMKYVPTQFKKRAWGFGIRATKRLRLGDGTHEKRAPTQIFADIEAAWASNTPLPYVDVDGVTYQVIVTDFKQKRPLLQIDRTTEQEAFYFLELLEV